MGVFRRRRPIEADECPSSVVPEGDKCIRVRQDEDDDAKQLAGRATQLYEYREDRSPSDILQAAYFCIDDRDLKLVSNDSRYVTIDECIFRAAVAVLDLKFRLDMIDTNLLKCDYTGVELQQIIDYIYLRDTGYWWRNELSPEMRKMLKIDEQRQDEVAEQIMDVLREAWECAKRDRDTADPIIPTNMVFHCTDGKFVRAHKCVLRSIRNIEGLYRGQERACVDKMLRAKKRETIEMPVSSTALIQLIDFAYTSWLEFDSNSAAGLYLLSCMFGPSLARMERFIMDMISENWDVVMASREFHRLPITRITILCKNEKFCPKTEVMRKSMERQLRKWMRRCPEKRTAIWEELMTLLNMQYLDEYEDPNKCFYHSFQGSQYRFNGNFWSHLTDRPGLDPSRFSEMYGVLSPKGEMLVADVDGTIGVLHSDCKFVKHSSYLPHDPLDWGYPFLFDNHAPYLALIFRSETYKERETLDLWTWRVSMNKFAPIKIQNAKILNIVEMQRHHTDASTFFIVANVFLTEEREKTVNFQVRAGYSSPMLPRRPPGSFMGIPPSPSTAKRPALRARATTAEIQEVEMYGVFKLVVTEKDGETTAKMSLLDKWTEDQYSNWYGNLRHLHNTLYKTNRTETREQINVHKYSDVLKKFVPLPCWSPSQRERIFTMGDECYLIAYDVGKGNWDVPSGFYKYQKRLDRWIDISVQSNFMAISGW